MYIPGRYSNYSSIETPLKILINVHTRSGLTELELNFVMIVLHSSNIISTCWMHVAIATKKFNCCLATTFLTEHFLYACCESFVFVKIAFELNL